MQGGINSLRAITAGHVSLEQWATILHVAKTVAKA